MFLSKTKNFYGSVNIIGHGLLFNATFLLIYRSWFSSFSSFLDSEFLLMATVFNIAWIVSGISQRLYLIFQSIERLNNIRNVVSSLVVHFLLVETFIGITGRLSFANGKLAEFYLLLFVLLVLWRQLAIRFLRIIRRKGYDLRKVIIIGSGEEANKLRHVFELFPEFGYYFMGYFDDKQKLNGDVRGRVADAMDFVLKNEIDEVYCSLSTISDSEVKRITDFCEKNLVKIKFLPQAKKTGFYKKYEVNYYKHIPVIDIKSSPLDHTYNQMLKRTFDIVFSGLFILLVFPVIFPVIALLIKLDSRGPVLYRQKRSGVNSRTFWCWKFRTMYNNKYATFRQATLNDDRVTRIGRVLRRTNLDELPQFFNVLLGDMSIIGPRPHPVELDEKYTALVKNYKHRMVVKPGISGLSQVKGYRGETEETYLMRNRVKMDIFYLENWSFLFDIKIIFLTLLNVFRGQIKAY